MRNLEKSLSSIQANDAGMRRVIDLYPSVAIQLDEGPVWQGYRGMLPNAGLKPGTGERTP